MKIRKISFENHPVLGTIELDFTGKNGESLSTIIIAGENGAGKSILLNEIFEFSTLSPRDTKNEKKSFEIELNADDIDKLKKDVNYKNMFASEIDKTILQINIDYTKGPNWDQITIKGRDLNGMTISPYGNLFAIGENRSILKMIFSDVEINFNSAFIQTVTSSSLDRRDIFNEKSTPNIATEIAQLLVDVQNADALDLSEWVKKNIGQAPSREIVDPRMRRFTNAFEQMFPTKRFKNIYNVQNNKKIVFEENGKEMPIDKLSSGEKQIVFRGGFLLRNKESLKGAIVLIDEPEISLHPNWQLKISKFFKTLFTDSSGLQTSQIIIATHSPFIIHNFNRKDDKVIVINKDNQGLVIVSKEPKFHSWSTEKMVQDAFNISHIINDKRLTILVEGETDEIYFLKTLEIFNNKEKKIEFKWIGRINEFGAAENSGNTALNHAKSFFLSNMELLHEKIVLLYDCDTKKLDEDHEKLFIRCMSKNNFNDTFKIGIENLLSLTADIKVQEFYTEKIKKNNYSAESTIRDLDKMKLCKFICESLSTDKQKVILAKVNNEIVKLLSLI